MEKMLDEIFRVLKEGGMYICFSLHSYEEVEMYLNRPYKLDWVYSKGRIKNPNFQVDGNRSPAHTVFVCVKKYKNRITVDDDNLNIKEKKQPIAPLLPGTMTDEEFHSLEKIVRSKSVEEYIEETTLLNLVESFDRALEFYSDIIELRDGPQSKELN